MAFARGLWWAGKRRSSGIDRRSLLNPIGRLRLGAVGNEPMRRIIDDGRQLPGNGAEHGAAGAEPAADPDPSELVRREIRRRRPTSAGPRPGPPIRGRRASNSRGPFLSRRTRTWLLLLSWCLLRSGYRNRGRYVRVALRLKSLFPGRRSPQPRATTPKHVPPRHPDRLRRVRAGASPRTRASAAEGCMRPIDNNRSNVSNHPLARIMGWRRLGPQSMSHGHLDSGFAAARRPGMRWL